MFYFLYFYYVYINDIYRFEEGWRYSLIIEYMFGMFKVLVNFSIYNFNVLEEKC